MPGHRSLAELVAELEDPQPTEIDPEAIERTQHASSSGEESDNGANREHYEDVGKSKLRKALQPTLGPEYTGSSISRADLYKDDTEDDPFSRKPDSDSDEDLQGDEEYDDPDQVDLNFQDDEDEDIDSDDAFGDGEEEILRKKGFIFRGSGKSSKTNATGSAAIPEQDSGTDQDEDDSAGSSDAAFSALDSNVSEDDSVQSETEASTHAENDSAGDEVLLATGLHGQKQIVADLSRSIDDEAKKGLSIQKQYTTFDTLVGTRIHLQKSLVAANSISAAEQADNQDRLIQAAKAAESAALGVLNSMTALLHSMHNAALRPKSESILGKRPFSATTTTSPEDIHQALSSTHKALKSHRRLVLTKSEIKQPDIKLSIKNRVVETEKDGRDEALVTRLDGLLLQTNQDRLIEKTRIARSCAPNAAETNEETGDTSSHLPVYDDADFYTLLLRELIDHKKTFTRTGNTSTPNGEAAQALNPKNLLHTNKSKRADVDTKASKGRKMKYVVHEKLQNFMAPVNLGTWESRQADELFASLLGRKVAHFDEEQEHLAAEEGEDMEMQGLRLFGGA